MDDRKKVTVSMSNLDHLEKLLKKPRTIEELCEKLSIDRTTIYRWFQKLEDERGRQVVTFGFRQPRRYSLPS